MQLVKNPKHCLDVAFALIFDVDEDIIQIHNNKDIKFFRKDLIDVALECCRSVGQSKKHYLIFEVAVSGPKSSFSLIFFANSHLVIGACEVKLRKPLCLPQLIQKLPNQRQWISVLHSEVVKSPIMNAKLETAIWLLIKKDGSSYWGFGGSDETIFQVGLNVNFQNF